MRPYTLGDDVRRIDWNVTARTGEPHVRLHVAERALETWLVLDTSASMTFGTADRRKWDVAEGVALAVGHFAARRGNRLAVSTFGDRRPTASPARQGTSGLLPLLLALRKEPDLEPAGPTSLGNALRPDRPPRPPPLARRRRLRLARPARLAPAAAAPRRPARRSRGRDPRSARAGAARRRRPLARRPRDRAAAPGRHAQPQAAAALRRASPPPTATRSRASCARSASATSSFRPRATG